MHKILVTLPSDRNFAGSLQLLDEAGNVLLGPIAVAGRSDDRLASRHQNPGRNPLLPYGDTPSGKYRVVDTITTGKDTTLASKEYGPAGVLMLQPLDGDAALADANGRFRFLIQGGAPASDGKLRPTAGSLRLTDSDQRRLVKSIRGIDRIICECIESQHASLTERIAQSGSYEESDPVLAAEPKTRRVEVGSTEVTCASAWPQPRFPQVTTFVPVIAGGIPTFGFLAVGGAGGSGGGSYGPDDFRITIMRQYPGKKCTSGYLAVNGSIICYTLERPWADNTQNISSIPAGTYNAHLRYDHSDLWRIELDDVPGRTNVQIHIGNQPSQTQGCILVGMQLGPDLCSLLQSALAYTALEQAFYGTANPVSTPDKTITVQLIDAGPVYAT